MHSSATHGKAPLCKLCDQAMGILLAAYGAEVGVACLKWIPFGGMYVAGGLTPKHLARLTEEGSAFLAAFHDKGRVSPLLRRVPLYAVLVEDIGQRGARTHLQGLSNPWILALCSDWSSVLGPSCLHRRLRLRGVSARRCARI